MVRGLCLLSVSGDLDGQYPGAVTGSALVGAVEGHRSRLRGGDIRRNLLAIWSLNTCLLLAAERSHVPDCREERSSERRDDAIEEARTHGRAEAFRVARRAVSYQPLRLRVDGVTLPLSMLVPPLVLVAYFDRMATNIPRVPCCCSE